MRIQSEFADDAASFDRLMVRNSSNLTFADLDLGRALLEGEPHHTQLNFVRDSENITLSGVRVHGSADSDPANDGQGLYVFNTRGLLVEDSVFSELYRGIAIDRSFNAVVRSTEFRTIRSDGMIVTATEGVAVRDNLFTDFRPKLGDHADGIQFWNTGQTKGSRDISIENNRFLFTEFSGVVATGVQGIYISDPLAFGFENVLIRNNALHSNGAYHGITVDGGRQLQITDNTVVSTRGDTYDFWVNVTESDRVIVDRNFSDNFIFRNVTKLFQGENINLKLTPGQAVLLPNLDAPEGADDLMVPGIGYSGTRAVEQAPVSDALSSALFGSMTGQQDLQAFEPVAVSEVPADGLRLSEIFATSPVVETSSIAAVPVMVDFDQPAAAWSFRNAIYADHFALA